MTDPEALAFYCDTCNCQQGMIKVPVLRGITTAGLLEDRVLRASNIGEVVSGKLPGVNRRS